METGSVVALIVVGLFIIFLAYRMGFAARRKKRGVVGVIKDPGSIFRPRPPYEEVEP